LKQAKADTKKVWIIGNLSPASPTCNHRWAKRYNYLIELYQEIIRMQLFGHETQDYFTVQ